MALPKSIRPEYSTTLPSTGKKIKYQPFSVKEEKVLIIAAEGEDPDEIANAVSNVLSRCITSPADFDVSSLSLFDIEYLFLKTRAKSAGETVSVMISDPDDEKYSTKVDINIDKIGIKRTENHSENIQLDEETTVVMRYPGIEFFSEGLGLSEIGKSISTVARCVKQIVVGEEVYSRADMSQEEIIDWLESMTTAQLEKFLDFFSGMPKLSHTITKENPNTGKKFTVTLEGLQDFF